MAEMENDCVFKALERFESIEMKWAISEEAWKFLLV